MNAQTQIKKMRDCYFSQPHAHPGEDWHAMVMRNVRGGAGAVALKFPEQIVWRIASVAAALAMLASITGIFSKPSRSALAWDIATSKATCEWVFASME